MVTIRMAVKEKVMNPWLPIPLMWNGDAYIITTEPVSDYQVRITSIARYANNQNVDGEELDFLDLDEHTRRAVIRQVNRRHKGMMVAI